MDWAKCILRSSPETLPFLNGFPAMRSLCKRLVDAAYEGEDVDTLWALVEPIESAVERLKNRPVEVKDSRPTVGNARDRFKRDKAAPRDRAPVRQPKKETPMRATGSSAEVKKPVRRQLVTAEALADQMCREYEALEASAPAQSLLELTAHAMTCLLPALHWVGGDPTTAQFPVAFQNERLTKTCDWLRGLTSPQQQEEARRQMLDALWELWPSYVDKCSDVPLLEESVSPYKERTWDFMSRVDSLWVDPGWNSKEIAPYLPEFRDNDCGRVSYSFHLTLLALVTLNRQTGRALLAFERNVN